VSQNRVPKYIDGFPKSYALPANGPTVDTVIIFVHGFGGKPTSTWTNFQGLVDDYSDKYPLWATSDMFFFAYESVRTPIRSNAVLFGDFVEYVWEGKWRGVDLPNAGARYKDLILVGHSEGGVIIRRLILDRFEAVSRKVKDQYDEADPVTLRAAMKVALTSDFILDSYLRLFAPACRGVNFSSWIGFLMSLSKLVSSMGASLLVRNELEKDSPVLGTLQAGTESAHAEFRRIRSLFTEPLFGVPDQIVYTESYKEEALKFDYGYDHFSVCTLSHEHLTPLEFVKK
jgi:hypothetical protein